MYPLKLEIKEIRYNISANCNEITLTTSDNRKILSCCDYDNWVDIDLLKEIVNTINESYITDKQASKDRMALYEKLYNQDTDSIDNAIATIKNMKNKDLKEKYKDYL